MLNLPGNSGKFFGDDINFYINDGFMTFTQGEQCLAVRGTDPIKYLDSPYYPVIDGKVVPFVIPEQRFEGKYEFRGLCIDFVRNMLLGENLKEFENIFGQSYFVKGEIDLFIDIREVINFWNKNCIKNIRLQTTIYNVMVNYFEGWGGRNDFKLFENRELPLIPQPPPVPKYKPYPQIICKCNGNTITRFKTIFGVLWPLARKQIHEGFDYSYFNPKHALNQLRPCEEFKCICDSGEYLYYQINVKDKDVLVDYPVCDLDMTSLTEFKKRCKEYNVFAPMFRPEFPLMNDYSAKMRLFVPQKTIIPGLPWDITAPFNYKLNGRDCHIEVLKARGGNFFSADLDKFKEKNEMKLEWDTNALLDFVYFREAEIKKPKAELALAKYVINRDYLDYVLNHLIDTDLYLYYKLK